MDMTFEEMLEFAKKHPPIAGGLDIRPEARWLGPGYNLVAREWNERHPEDPVELMPPESERV